MNVQAVPANGQVEVTWSAPVDTGIEGGQGSSGVITEYRVYYDDGTTGNLARFCFRFLISPIV